MRLTDSLTRASTPLGVFRHRNFTFVWGSTALVGIGTQMESAVLGWFVLSLTDSPFLVGSIAAARMALNFLALFAGAIADRLPRNLMLVSVEFVMGSMGILMLALILTDMLEVWHIFAITLFMGVVRLFQMPAAQSLVADTLPRERVNNGAAFNTVAMNIAMLCGPVIGGLLYKGFGPQGAYMAIASLYLASGMVAVGIRIDRSATSRPSEPVLRAVIAGLKYAAGNQVIWAVLTAAVVMNLAGWTVHTSLAPIFARDVLGTDSAGLGLLLFAFGVGALSGSLGLAMAPSLPHHWQAAVRRRDRVARDGPALFPVPVFLPVDGAVRPGGRGLRLHAGPGPHAAAAHHAAGVQGQDHGAAFVRHPRLQLRKHSRRSHCRNLGRPRSGPGSGLRRHHANPCAGYGGAEAAAGVMKPDDGCVNLSELGHARNSNSYRGPSSGIGGSDPLTVRRLRAILKAEH